GFDRSNRISVNIYQEDSETDLSGFIVGYDEEEELLLLELNQYSEDLEVEQSVFSSGLGGVFPKGLEIGEIVEINEDDYQLTSMASVKPSADLKQFQHVIVIDRAMTTVDEEVEEDES